MVQNCLSDLEWPGRALQMRRALSGRALGIWLERVLGLVWRHRAAVEVEGRTPNGELHSALLDQWRWKDRAGTGPSRGRSLGR